MSGGYFTTDRARKYGWGVPRLALLTLFAFEVVPRYFLDDASGSELHAFAAAEAHPGDGTATYPLRLGAYLRSLRWAGHAYMGSIGAGVNVQVLGFVGNLAMLLAAAAFCVADAAKDYSIIVYLAKTFSGDFLAGKLDTAEWKLVLFWTFGVLGPGLWVLAGLDGGEVSGISAFFADGLRGHKGDFNIAFDGATAARAFAPYARVLPVLFLIQTVCEFGDAHLEHHRIFGTFFRHRYGFECFTLLAMTAPKALAGGIRPKELRVVQHDLVICLFYRVSNLCIILVKNGWLKDCGARAERVARKALFRVFAAVSNQRLANITDVDVATAVLKQSSIKGDGLERHVATPAWRPLLSLESVDGDLYERMVRAFHELVAELPEPRAVAEIAEARAEEMLATARARAENDAKETTEANSTTEAIVTLSTVAKEAADSKEGSCTTKPHDSEKNREDLLRGARAIDAHAVARFSLAVFVEYVFGRKWESAFEVLVDASWEWRREIAVRGRADISVKRDAVRLVVGDLLRNNEKLWAMHGEAWWEPRNYSLVMQPFLISPAINVGDVAVALKRRPGSRLEDAMRDAHPFPIFERFVEEDVYVDRRAGRGATSGRNAIPRSALKRSSRPAVKKNTQVIMFTSDFRGSDVPWPVFGAGPRMCAGTSAALGVLRVVASTLAAAGEAFAPEAGHKYSGRHNDGVSGLSEAWYFARTVAPIVLGFGRERQDGDALERRAREALGKEMEMS